MRSELYKVVAAGIANSGKSSILSALAGQRGLFPEGDVPRITKTIKPHVAGGILLVDTPGLDANELDTRKQMNELLSADTVLWCHNLRKGELGIVEVDALKQYANDTDAIWRTCFVLTHGDDMPSWKVIRTVSDKIALQLHDIFDLHFVGVDGHVAEGAQRRPRPFNVIGVERYWKGVRSDSSKDANWLGRSGVPSLKAFLYELAEKNAAHRCNWAGKSGARIPHPLQNHEVRRSNEVTATRCK